MPSVAEQIRTYAPDASRSWLPLDALFSECFNAKPKEEEVEAVFALFERYPEDDGAGVFWTAIHGLEAGSDYEARLKRSLQVAPSLAAVALAIRIVNSGDASFLPLIVEVASRSDVPASVRKTATNFLEKRSHG